MNLFNQGFLVISWIIIIALGSIGAVWLGLKIGDLIMNKQNKHQKINNTKQNQSKARIIRK